MKAAASRCARVVVKSRLCERLTSRRAAPRRSGGMADEVDASSKAFDEACLHGRLVHGSCGWAAKNQNLSIYTSAEMSSGVARLPKYSEHFGCVEVDSSTYAIPSPDAVTRWVQNTPEGFTFLVKAFGGFCASSVAKASLPRDVRELLETHSERVAYARMPEGAKDLLWAKFNESMEPITAAGRLGCVVFQFHLSQPPGDSLREHILECKARLKGAKMAIEFRNREWLTGDTGEETVRWAKDNDLLLVAADELEHETFQRDRAQTGLPPGAVRRRMFTRLECTVDWGALIRVHRRHGTTERVLDADEISFWAERIRDMSPKPSKGPIWVAWGTEWIDAPLTNAKNLDAAVDPPLRYDWHASRHLRRPSRAKKSTIATMFAAAAKKSSSSGTRPDESSSKRRKKDETGPPQNPIATLWARASREK
jgi:uncharacterized protein YecE (DUF72 family)